MTGIFRANNPLNTFLLFVYGIFLKFVWLLHPQIPVIEKSGGFLFNDIIQAIQPYFDAYPSAYFVITYLLLFTQAVTLNQLITSRRLMQKPNYLPAMSYLLITSFFPEWNVLSPALIINTFLIWVWSKMSNLNNSQHPKSTLFNVGIAIGICTFFYLPCFAFAAFIILTLLITRPPKVAEWLITFIGILTPWYFFVSYLFFTNRLYSFRVSGLGISHSLFKPSIMEITGISLIGLMIIMGAFFVQTSVSKQVLQVRKNWSLLFLFLIISIAIPFIDLHHSAGYWFLALIPASAFIGCAFYYPRTRWIPMVLQWIMVGFVVYMQYFKK
ncbi:MAG: DUF6427 family protein [Ginsengibacter sp.]